MEDGPKQTQNTIQIQIEAAEYPVIPGSSSTISFDVRNLGSKQDYFEIAVLGAPSTWISIPTPVIMLSPGQQTTVGLSVTAPASPQVSAGWYPIKILVTSQSDRKQFAEVEIALKVAVYEVQGRIGVLMHSNQFTVTPGSSVTIPIVMRNQGLQADTFRIGVEGIPAGWVSTTSPATQLDPGEQKGITISIRPPQNAQSKAGRHPFTIQVISQDHPDQVTLVDCILTLAAYTQFGAELEPARLQAGQPGRLIISNMGNIQQTYTLTWASPENALLFRPEQPEPIRVQAGEAVLVEFIASPRLPPLIGREAVYPFSAYIQSAEKEMQVISGEITKRALIPIWLLVLAVLLGLAAICISAYLLFPPGSRDSRATQTAQALVSGIAGATQTAAFNQTQAAVIGQQDSDGDGLTNQREAELGTDPNNPDGDGDELWDGDEVLRNGTDPKNRDTDVDELTDGEEVLRRGTDPKNPDTDGDRLKDGEEVRLGTDPKNPDSDADTLGDADEVQVGTNPLNPDTDGDRLIDGDEVRLSTNPLNPDTDNDRLMDGSESNDCPNFFNPDTDGDAIIDGLDIDKCDPQNPSLTATVNASITPVPSTLVPTLLPTQSPTGQPTAVSTAPVLSGIIAFESNRDGQSDIYISNPATGSFNRLTSDPGVDSQPSLSSDGTRVAFTSNRTGNNDIFVMNADGSGQTNLTNNPADDSFPDWSPDGQWIAFTTNRDGNQEIYVMRSDGTELRNVSNNPANDFQASWFLIRRVFGADDWFVFTSDRDGNQEVYSMRPNGLEQVNISLNPADDNAPQGDSEGAIVFSSNRDGNYDIFSINLDGTALSKLTTNPVQDQWPVWSSDGQWIAFTTERDGNPEIYVMRNNGADAANYTRNPSSDTHPSWR